MAGARAHVSVRGHVRTRSLRPRPIVRVVAPRLLLRIVLGAAVLVAVVGAARPGSPLAVAGRDDPYPRATAAAAAATFTFAPGVDPLNQRAWLDAVARVRPEARALFDRVDGLVTVEDAEPPPARSG